MKLDNKEFAEYKRLVSAMKAGKIKPESQEAKRLAELTTKRNGENAFSWWNKYPELTAGAANIVFNTIVGISEHTEDDNFDVDYFTTGVRCAILPTIGVSVSENSAFNYQMRNLWLAMHRKYRGLGAYEYADLGMALFAIMSFFGDIARAERMYGACSYFITRNRSVPLQLLRALGYFGDEINQAQLADFRYQLNRLITGAKALCLPKGFSLFEAYIRLFANVFKDSESVRAQWIVHDSEVFVTYDADGMSTGGSCKYTYRSTQISGGGPINGGYQRLADIIKDLETQYNALINDTDIARMCSDILAAFGDNDIVTLGLLPEDYIIEPVHEETAVLQLHNATIVGSMWGGDFTEDEKTAILALDNTRVGSYRVFQSNGVIKQHLFAVASASGAWVGYKLNGYDEDGKYVPTCYPDYFPYIGKPLLNIFKDQVSAEDIMEITRFTVAKTPKRFMDGDDEVGTIDIAYGPFVIYKLDFFTTFSNNITTSIYGDTIGLPNGWETLFAKIYEAATILSNIDWHPAVYIRDEDATIYRPLFDVDNYCLADKTAIARLHDAALMSGLKLDSVMNVKD